MLADYYMRGFFLILLFNFLNAQDYDIKLWGIPIGSANLVKKSVYEVELTINSNEFIHSIYPLSYKYYSKFDKSDYTVVELNKQTKQGKNVLKYSAEYSDNLYAVYNNEDSLKIRENTYSLLSLISKIINSPVDSIDAKWFNLENAGILYKARPLWNDTTTVYTSKNNILCDHYRLDLKIIDDNNKIFDETDYFNDLFFDINSVRQLWVETWQKQRRLVKIALKNTLLNLEIVVKD